MYSCTSTPPNVLPSMRRIVLVFAFLAFASWPVYGQTIWSRPYEANQLVVETFSPDPPEGSSLLTGASFVSGTVALSRKVELAGELPIARYTPAQDDLSPTTALGNPYLGLGFSSTRLPILFQFGVRIPSAPINEATLVAESVDMGRSRAFRPDELSFTGLFNARRSVGRQSSLRFRGGMGYARYASTVDTIESRMRDWRLHYEVQLWREGDWLLTGWSLTGQAVFSRPRSTRHHFVVSFMGDWARIQPGVVGGLSLNALLLDERFAPFVGLTLSITHTAY